MDVDLTPLRGPEDLTDVAPLQDPNYLAVTLGLDRLEVAQRVSLISWEVVSVEFLHCSDGLRNKALAAHFAIASWFGAVTQGHDTSNLRKALAADSSRHMVELSFTGCRGFGDNSLQQLLNHLPRLFGLGFQHVAQGKLKVSSWKTTFCQRFCHCCHSKFTSHSIDPRESLKTPLYLMGETHFFPKISHQ